MEGRKGGREEVSISLTESPAPMLSLAVWKSRLYQIGAGSDRKSSWNTDFVHSILVLP